jgi:uncharacterized protein (TIGR01777 family)
MKIVIAGGSGFVGKALVKRLEGHGEVVVLTRSPSASFPGGRAAVWDSASRGPWTEEIASADVVINLAGENIGASRWSEERKRRLIASRLISTQALVDAMNGAPSQSRTFISASAIGFYGARGDEELDENAPAGSDFLASLTMRWEETARGASGVSRLVIFRIGIVLAADGGALAKMLLPFRLGVGGPLGHGRQWMSWIDRDDLLSLVEWAIDHDRVRGVYNATAPEAVPNQAFTMALGRALHRPAILPAPGFALRLAFGEMADSLLLNGQRVLPARALAQGFSFQYPNLDRSLAHVLAR